MKEKVIKNKYINYHPESNTFKKIDYNSWYFYPGDVDGIRVMTAVRIFDLESAIENCKGNKNAISNTISSVSYSYNSFEFNGRQEYGSICAYVECTPEQAKEDNDYTNGGFTYGSFNEETGICDLYKFEFPDGTKATEGKVIVGWDYNHGWDKDSDKDDAESDIFRFCCKLLGKEIKNNIVSIYEE